MNKTIHATDGEINQQITNSGQMVARVDNDQQVTLTKNFGPDGVPGVGKYNVLLVGNPAGDYNPTPLQSSFRGLAGVFTGKITEIRAKLESNQNQLMLASSDLDKAELAAQAAAQATP